MTASFDSTLANLGIQRSGAATGKAAASANPATQMDQSDFLSLMTAQMKNQDPFDPVDNTQMVAQMAQFSSLAGISEMNTTLKSIADRLGANTASDAMAWVGKTVLTPGTTAYPAADGSLTGAIELGSPASAVNVTIAAPDGSVLRTVALGPQAAGTINYGWDGTTDSGDPAPAGPYTITVRAADADGARVSATPLVWAPVASVSLPAGGEPVLSLPGLGQVPVSAVRQIG